MEDGALAQLIKMVGGCDPTPSTSHSTPAQSTTSPVQRSIVSKSSSHTTTPKLPPTVNTFYPQIPQPDIVQLFYFQQLMQQKFYADLMAMSAMTTARSIKEVSTPQLPTTSSTDPKADPLMSLYDMVNPDQKPKKEDKEPQKLKRPNFSIEGLLCSQKSERNSLIKNGGVIKTKRKHIELNRYSQ
ncbi:unnamed protein product [Bursaphelenchus okinawaensis]|uniref:Uncharacterized protein n=1 Tax=Bursaphelenchus okinawaensis TaxID=465554 RepID=A0A811K7T6_9BILA|nr:unnamed protein product [Bursaphelenchus okinawaensis]CAG9095059.1 unnamed protein product [Bursaphelenchus okinawaensis]